MASQPQAYPHSRRQARCEYCGKGIRALVISREFCDRSCFRLWSAFQDHAHHIDHRGEIQDSGHPGHPDPTRRFPGLGAVALSEEQLEVVFSPEIVP